MRFLTFLEPTLSARICKELERAGQIVAKVAKRRKGLELELIDKRIDVLVIGAGSEYLDLQILNACDLAGIRVLALSNGPADRRNSMTLGLNEVLDSSATWPQMEAILLPNLVQRVEQGESVEPVAAPPRTRGQVISVWGPAGSPGRTTISISIAAELAAKGLSVALLDADTHSGAVAPTLGLLDEAPGLAAACRLVGNESLSIAELERVAETYHSVNGSFKVLTGLGRPHRWPELSAARMKAVIKQCTTWCDFTIIDTGSSLEADEEISSDISVPRRNAATLTSLESSDLVLAIGAGDPVGLARYLRAHTELVELVDPIKILCVVNKVRAGVVGANPAAQVERTLLRFGGINLSRIVPFDLSGFDSATLSGKTILDVSPRSAARVAISKIADELSHGVVTLQAG
ncbi:MAG: regulator [Cryobacterium sp.]|nr:regulator [Cryobacterium sp.]